MKDNEKPRPGRIPGGSLFAIAMVMILTAGSAQAAGTSANDDKEKRDGTTTKRRSRLYTNADLPKPEPAQAPVPGRRAPITNAQLKEPLPTQRAPIAETPSWDVVFEWLERERAYESQRRQQELELALALAAAAEARQGPHYYHPAFPYYYTGQPFVRGTPPAPTPSNPFASLRERGVRTSVDLYRESVRDARINRNSLP